MSAAFGVIEPKVEGSSNSCVGCKFAEWEKAKGGRLHPSGDGMCTWKLWIPELPPSMEWSYRIKPKPMGGFINRRVPLKSFCRHYNRG